MTTYTYGLYGAELDDGAIQLQCGYSAHKPEKKDFMHYESKEKTWMLGFAG